MYNTKQCFFGKKDKQKLIVDELQFSEDELKFIEKSY